MRRDVKVIIKKYNKGTSKYRFGSFKERLITILGETNNVAVYQIV